MKTINVKIPAMKSAHCMMTVTHAIQALKDVTLKNISPGKAEIELLNTNQVSVIEAINNAGYQITEIETILNMETKTYKTNIKCEGCLAKVTPYLNESVGEGNWKVNLNDPAKTLSILTDSPEGTVKQALEKAGYKGERQE